jgi:CHAD domain-containing protein
MSEHREVERTYAPPADAPVPDLSMLPGVASLGPGRVDDLEAVYFDTADLALTRAGVSLRRRTGGTDEGWHLKIPAEDGREEIQLPLTRALTTPPARLRAIVAGWTAQAPLEPIARITTQRTRRNLLAADGTVLAELADDRVTGIPEGSGAPVSWREWELELVDGERTLLDGADDLLGAAGVHPSAVARKIEHVLGERLPPAAPAPVLGVGRAAGPVLHLRLREQVAELHRRDSQVRRRQDEGVHRARVACRRLRTALATYRPLLDRDVTDPIRAEIKWFGQCLSDARDAHVVRDRLRAMVDDEPHSLVRGPVKRRLDTTVGAREKEAWATIEEVMSSTRYFRLLGDLDRLVAVPPWTDVADQPAGEVLPRRVRKDWRRLRDRKDEADRATDADERQRLMHEVRKDAKRLRYAAETLRPVWGKDAHRLAKAAKRLTSHLGERQDTVMSRPMLLAIAADADEAGESSVVWGLLYGREEQRAADLDHELDRVWATVSKKKLRRWLS